MQYNHNLALAAGKRVAEIWGTKTLNKDERTCGSMLNVQAPQQEYSICSAVALDMMDNANCFPIVVQFNGRTYVRLSAQIYNEMSDY